MRLGGLRSTATPYSRHGEEITVHFAFKKNVVVHKKIRVNGQEYENLDQVPAEYRAALEKALGGNATAATKITVNGHTYGSGNDLPAPVRAVVHGLALMALRKAESASPDVSPVGEVRVEPVVSLKRIVFVVAAAALVIWLARVIF